MRLIKVIADGGHLDTLASIAMQNDIVDSWQGNAGADGRIMFHMMVSDSRRQSVAIYMAVWILMLTLLIIAIVLRHRVLVWIKAFATENTEKMITQYWKIARHSSAGRNPAFKYPL